MVVSPRRLLLSLSLGGCLTGAAGAQQPLQFLPTGEPASVPATEIAAADETASPSAPAEGRLVPQPDVPGVVHITDCPPGRDRQGEQSHRDHRGMLRAHEGWTEPGRVAMHRHWVPYYKFFPNAWTGQPTPVPQVRLPMVYMPTDTTQLGYYYQQVPHWHAYRGMIPPVPRPADWHIPLRPQTIGATGTQNCPPEQVIYGEPEPLPTPAHPDMDKSAAVELIPIPG